MPRPLHELASFANWLPFDANPPVKGYLIDPFGAFITHPVHKVLFRRGERLHVEFTEVRGRDHLDQMLIDLCRTAVSHTRRYKIDDEFKNVPRHISNCGYCDQDTLIFFTGPKRNAIRLCHEGGNRYGAIILNPHLVGIIHDYHQRARIHAQVKQLIQDRMNAKEPQP